MGQHIGKALAVSLGFVRLSKVRSGQVKPCLYRPSDIDIDSLIDREA